MAEAFITRRGGGAAGLNFRIIGGATQPTSAKENDIWVNTAQEITSWDFEAVEPCLRSTTKNLIAYPYFQTTHTASGITSTDNGDGTLLLSGTATANKYTTVRGVGSELLLLPGTYTLSGCPAGGSESTYCLILRTQDYSVNVREYGDGVTFTLDHTAKVFVIIGVMSGVTINATFKPQVEKGGAVTDFAKGDATGQVWISTAAASDMEFNALKKNGVQVYPIAVKQYISGAWEDTEAYIYQAGAWVELGGSLVLFDGDDGGDNTEITGGWSTITTAGGTTTVTSSSIAFCANVSGTVRRAGTVNAVDLSEYKTLYFDGVNNGTADSANYSFILLTERSNSATAVATVRQPFNTRDVVSIDLTAITSREAVYIAISNSSSSATSVIYRCWAE